MSAAVDKDPSGETGMKGLGGLDLGTPESGVRGSQEGNKMAQLGVVLQIPTEQAEARGPLQV